MIPHSLPFLTHDDETSLALCLEKKHLNTGFKDDELRDYFLSRFHKETFKLVTSGSAAFFLILKSLDLQEEDEVILPAYVCQKVYETIKRAGATPILCDIGGDEWCVTMDSVQRYRTDRTKAIVLVNTFGHPVNITSFKGVNIPLILDCCHDFNSLHFFKDGCAISQSIDFLFTSFNATKPITSGTGGLAFCVKDSYASSFQQTYVLWKDMFDMNDLQRSLLWTQIHHYEGMVKRKEEISDVYLKNIQPALIAHYQYLKPGFRFLLTQKRFSFENVKKRYEDQGIHVRRGIDTLLHHVYPTVHHYPVAEEIFEKTVSIPFYPSLRDEEVHHVVRVTKDIFGS